MAYDPQEIKKRAIEVIGKNKLIFIEDICAMVGISKETYYRFYPIDSDDYDELSKLLQENKITLKVSIRNKWSKSDNPTAQMALYKLCSTAEEHKKLQQNYTDVTSGGETIVYPPIIVDSKQHADMIENLSDD